MNNAILIQHGSGPAEDLLKISETRHREYCERQGFEYQLSTYEADPVRHAMWETVRLLLKAVRSRRYEWIVWLDADALIVDLDADLRLRSEGKLLGLVEMVPDVLHINTQHFNFGVVLLHCPTAESRMGTPADRRLIDFLEYVWSQWPVADTDEQQVAVNRFIEERRPDWVEKLPRTYNSIPYIWRDEAPAVLAWHGYLGDKAAAMREALEGTDAL